MVVLCCVVFGRETKLLRHREKEGGTETKDREKREQLLLLIFCESCY